MKVVQASGHADAWVAAHRDRLRAGLDRHGAVLVTGARPADLAAVRAALGAVPAPAQEQFAPRRRLGDAVYAAPQWAADREMCHHHEQGYARTPPRLLILTATRVPERGGTLLLADTRRVADHVPAALADRFGREGWLLVRNYHPHLGLSWSAAFGVDSPAAVAELCAARGITYRWEPDGTLHTVQHRPAYTTNPRTGDTCWFNDVAFFNQWSVAEEEREVLLRTFGPDGIPFNTFAGDGTPLSAPEFDGLLAAYEAVTERVRMRPGDLLLLDNLCTAHGREPYTGTFELAMALGD